MKNRFCFFIVVLSSLIFTRLGLGSYEPEWESLDKREVPDWWTDAKFGIFIHWGPYSVPAFTKVGQYAEWYWKDLKSPGRKAHEEVLGFHNDFYGASFTYHDFVPKFTTELFDPDEWAQLFSDSGAKYVVLTSKHHDGYCLWPSDEADRSWGRPWNSLATGPRRDLLGELTASVREAELRMGIYYSLYEWYNPLYVSDVDLYVEKHMIPQFKDVVSRYAPSVIFSDGEWEHSDKTWRSEELLAWVYNESPRNEEIVVNDRWGKGSRHTHGGYHTTEYTSGVGETSDPWEESRGMGYSYGFNRAEAIGDYKTSREFIYMLVDIVSRGGNFLLNIGPTADGRIPVIMQQRLMDIGEWLDVNGEAIYDTKPWLVSCQWSEGERPIEKRGEYMVEYDILKLTVEPDDGVAYKEIWFTQKDDVLYCIMPRYSDGKMFVEDLTVEPDCQITLLGMKEPLEWTQADHGLEVDLPVMNPNSKPSKYAWTLKIDGLSL
ncbi:alpha-L-fucosidase [Pelagicoccus mobilis]|uniref:alpha-L-fucosidase n=1 Tax=Pelagicoccus mobilis TaxID=415221 RepID=A0A934VNE1_9BACT|nr:alpha-L-fucosidase [Pelagicoccus mobilis]MBK1876127.1 alpha-L-fucosidase [Pelagicoccus mobilis]